MRIRDAQVDDIPRLMELAKETISRSIDAHAPMDEGAIRRQMLYCVSSKSQFLMVAEVDGQVEGMLAGTVDKIWYSTKKVAQEIFFYTTEKGSHAAGLLARRWIRWAKKRQGVVSVSLSIPQQDPRAKRVGKLMGKMGLEFTVATYEEVQHVQENSQGNRESDKGHWAGDQEGGKRHREGS